MMGHPAPVGRAPRWWTPSVVGALAVLATVGAWAFVPELATSSNPLRGRLGENFRPVAGLSGGSLSHPLGTDSLGRDVFARVVHGARPSLLVGGTAVVLAGLLGIAAGLLAGYLGRGWDLVLMGAADIQLGLPFLLLAITLAAIFGAGLGTAILALVLTGWVPYARLTRAELLSMREQLFVQAGQALGASPARVMLRHVLPNLGPTLVVVATFSFAQMIIMESALSFLGLGIQPPQPSWGSMLSDARNYLMTAWWAGVFPGVAIVATVLAINVVGERLREILDPRLRGL
jgi:ABC-type dipeptide/oligopeptide/nickel transport system permease subunit